MGVVNYWALDCVCTPVVTFVPIMSLLELEWVSHRGVQETYIYINPVQYL